MTKVELSSPTDPLRVGVGAPRIVDRGARLSVVASHGDAVELEVGDRTVRISNPERVYFPARGETKLDLARYYLSVGDGIVRALCERPCMMHRFPRSEEHTSELQS